MNFQEFFKKNICFLFCPVKNYTEITNFETIVVNKFKINTVLQGTIHF